MARYYVCDHPKSNGVHEVHVTGCKYITSALLHLGEHSMCTTAVSKARLIYRRVNGCKYCSNLCHIHDVS